MASHLRPIDAQNVGNATPAQIEGIVRETEPPTKGTTTRRTNSLEATGQLTVTAWIYRMARGEKKSIENLNENEKGKSSLDILSSSSHTQNTTGNAMKRLNTALDQLANSTPTPESHPVHDTMSPSGAARYIEGKLLDINSLDHFTKNYLQFSCKSFQV